MRFKHHSAHPGIPNAEAWQTRRGFWSFLILHEKAAGKLYITSYRDQREPVDVSIRGKAVIFCGDREFRNTEAAPSDCGHKTVDDAIRACEAKYKELLLR